MPLLQAVKDHLASMLSYAGFATDEYANHLPLATQLDAWDNIQKTAHWQLFHPFSRLTPTRDPIKIVLSDYLNVQRSTELFIRFVKAPTFETISNLPYFENASIQNLVYKTFLKECLPFLLNSDQLPPQSCIDDFLYTYAKERIAGYAEKEDPQQSEEDWKIFIAEVNEGLLKLSPKIYAIFEKLHTQFVQFRRDHLEFLDNFFSRCNFLCQFEQWLKENSCSNRPMMPLATMALLDQCLENLKFPYQLLDLKHLFNVFRDIKYYSIDYDTYQILVNHLIELRIKYDAVRAESSDLSVEQEQAVFQAAWQGQIDRQTIQPTVKEQFRFTQEMHRRSLQEKLQDNGPSHRKTSLSLR